MRLAIFHFTFISKKQDIKDLIEYFIQSLTTELRKVAKIASMREQPKTNWYLLAKLKAKLGEYLIISSFPRHTSAHPIPLQLRALKSN